MSDTATLLPPNAASGTRALAASVARIGAVPVPLTRLWDPYTCPLSLLPWLAWALSVDAWKSYWPEAVKRRRVAQAIDIQRRKGSARSVLDVVASFGGAVVLREWFQSSPPAAPYTFDIAVTGGMGASAAVVDDIIAEVGRVIPVRCHFTLTQGIAASVAPRVTAVARAAVYARLNLEVQ